MRSSMHRSCAPQHTGPQRYVPISARNGLERRHLKRHGLGFCLSPTRSCSSTGVQAVLTEPSTADGMCYLQDCHSRLQFPSTLPIMPFTPNEALAPGCTKVLHLYEDKDLALLEAVMTGTVSQGPSESCDDTQDSTGASLRSPRVTAPASSHPRLFIHSTIEMGNARHPCVACASSSPGALVQGDFVFFLSTLVQVVDVRCAAHGGLDVTIRGEGRVRLARLKQLNPYITGEVWPVVDMVPKEVLEAASNPLPEQASEHTPDQAPQLLPDEASDPGSTRSPSLDPTLTPHEQRSVDGGGGDGVDSENDAMCDNMGDESDGGDGACLRGVGAMRQEVEFPAGREQPSVEEDAPEAAGAGWVLRAMVQELRQVTKDVCTMLVKMGRPDRAEQIAAALAWADDPAPLMCNLGTGQAAADLYLPRGKDGSVQGATGCRVPLPCAVSQLDRATRLSFALLTLAQGAGGEGWTGGAAAVDPCRAALCTLDTRERLQIVTTAAKSTRAKLAAQAAIRRLRRM